MDGGFPHSSVGKESTCNAGDSSSIPGLGRSTGEGIGYPLQYSWALLVVQLVKNLPAVRETWVWSLGWEDSLENGKLLTLVFWPGEFHGLYSPWDRKESDMTEWFSLHFSSYYGKWDSSVISLHEIMINMQYVFFQIFLCICSESLTKWIKTRLPAFWNLRDRGWEVVS